MKSNTLVKHLASVLGDSFNLTLDDIDQQETEADKEIIYGLICLHDDLDFYKRRSDNLLDNLKNTLFNSAAITVTGSNGVIKEVNSTFLDLCGYSEKELYGNRLSMIDAPDDQSEEYETLITDITQGKTWRGEVKSISKNQDEFWLNTHIFPVRNVDGDIYEYWSVSTDITQRKNMELQLVKKNKDLQEFSYMLSHDLKAPGRQIKNLADIIEDECGELFNEEAKELFSLLKSRASKLNELIDGILDYSRADYNVTNENAVDLNDLIDDYIAINKLPASIELEIPENLPQVYGNHVKVKQVFENLIGNAIKYMDKEDGKIKLSHQVNGEFVHFKIEDNGPGIKSEYLDNIFGMFVTAHENKDRQDSTGIGLAVTKKIIKAYGGNISCESNFGEGTTFSFSWPKKQISA